MPVSIQSKTKRIRNEVSDNKPSKKAKVDRVDSLNSAFESCRERIIKTYLEKVKETKQKVMVLAEIDSHGRFNISTEPTSNYTKEFMRGYNPQMHWIQFFLIIGKVSECSQFEIEKSLLD